MTGVQLAISPIDLANLLSNAVEISKEAARIEHPPVVLVAYQPSPDGVVGTLYSYGCGRYAAGRTRAVLDGLPSAEAMSLSITRDHAAGLSSELRKLSRAAGTRVGVTMHDEPFEGVNPDTGKQSWGNFAISWQDKYLTHLHDADPHGKYDAIWQRVDELASPAGDPLPGLALQVGVLSRLTKMRAVGEIADLRSTPLPGVVAAKLGPDFVGLLGEVNRASFVAGGKWGNGPGSPEQLWAANTTSN